MGVQSEDQIAAGEDPSELRKIVSAPKKPKKTKGIKQKVKK